MNLPSIQQIGMYFSGFFEYEKEFIREKAFLADFEFSRYHIDNKDYLRQKYYSNWIQTLYPEEDKLKEMGLPFLEGNHLYLKNADKLKQRSFFINNREYQFIINKVGIYLFQQGLGIFSINVRLENANWTFEEISAISNFLRNTNVNPKITVINPIIHLIEEDIIPNFSSNIKSWQNFNPYLKLFLNIDVDSMFESEKALDNLLFDLATVSPIGTSASADLYAPSERYYNELLSNNTLSIFRNWKMICLFDSMVRISVNLKKIDAYNLWETDYYTIYIFTCFIRFYLYRTNARLATPSQNIKDSATIRNHFIHFMNDFDLTQISYKFLPNAIYRELLKALEVEEELKKLEQKISRIDTSIRERQEKRIEALLFFLTILSLLSIVYDGSELIMSETGMQTNHQAYTFFYRLTSISIIVFFIITGWVIYYRRRKS